MSPLSALKKPKAWSKSKPKVDTVALASAYSVLVSAISRPR
jgi:hypothetical protein